MAKQTTCETYKMLIVICDEDDIAVNVECKIAIDGFPIPQRGDELIFDYPDPISLRVTNIQHWFELATASASPRSVVVCVEPRECCRAEMLKDFEDHTLTGKLLGLAGVLSAVADE